MALAGAGFGAARTLEQIVAERMAAQQLEQEIAERQQRFDLEQRRVAEAERQNTWERGRAEKLDTERAEERRLKADADATAQRGRGNMAGVAAMGLDPATTRREIAFSSLQSGADVPSGVMEAMTPPKPLQYTHTDPRSGNKTLRFANPDQIPPEGLDLGNEPQRPTGEKGPFVVNGKLVGADGKVIFDGGGQGPSPYAQERAIRTEQSVDELLGKVSRWNTGFGSLLSFIPETEARNFGAELDTLKANIAFNELTQMREASKTGGALGSVAVREMELLQSALGALDAGQSPANLSAQLQKVKDSIGRWTNAHSGVGAAPPQQTPSAAPRRLRFDKTGKPIP